MSYMKPTYMLPLPSSNLKKSKTPASEEPPKKQHSASRSTPTQPPPQQHIQIQPQKQKLSASQPLRTSNTSTKTTTRSLGSTYAAPAIISSTTPPKNSKSKSAPPSTNKRVEKKLSETNLRNVGEIISNTPDFSKSNTYPEPVSQANATPLYPSVQHNQVYDSNGKDFDTLSAYNALNLLRDTVHANNANTTYTTTFNTTIHHQAPIATQHAPSSNYNNYSSAPTISHRPQSPTRMKPQENLLITFTTADGGEYVVPLHTARHSRLVSATLATSLHAAANHRFEFSTVTSEVMGTILKFLENPFMYFLNTRKASLLPGNPFQHIGAAKTLLAGDAMEIPLVIVYCTSLLLSSGNTTELQKYLPTTFLFQRSPIADWYSLQDTVDSLLPTTATHTSSPSPSRSQSPSPSVITTTTRPSCESGMDFLWHVRFINDFGAGDINYREAAFSWKRVYAESRVQSFLLAGLDQLDELELVQWKRYMAPLVQSLDLSESSVHDDVVSLVLRLCVNLQRLDLHHSQITDESLLLIAEAAREGHELTWINLQYTHVSREGVHSFSLCCPNTSIVL